jgi:hypothetical protein
MPLKGLSTLEAAWLRRRARALGSLDAALRLLIANGRRAELAARVTQQALRPTPSATDDEDATH